MTITNVASSSQPVDENAAPENAQGSEHNAGGNELKEQQLESVSGGTTSLTDFCAKGTHIPDVTVEI